MRLNFCSRVWGVCFVLSAISAHRGPNSCKNWPGRPLTQSICTVYQHKHSLEWPSIHTLPINITSSLRTCLNILLLPCKGTLSSPNILTVPQIISLASAAHITRLIKMHFFQELTNSVVSYKRIHNQTTTLCQTGSQTREMPSRQKGHIVRK